MMCLHNGRERNSMIYDVYDVYAQYFVNETIMKYDSDIRSSMHIMEAIITYDKKSLSLCGVLSIIKLILHEIPEN